MSIDLHADVGEMDAATAARIMGAVSSVNIAC
jgi:lactam utilization protein B